MAKYRLIAPAIIDDVQREIGYEFEFDGEPGPHMELIEEAAKKPEAAPPAETKPEEKKEEDRAGPGGHRRG